MSKVFKIWPKKVIKRNGLTLTPEQTITITAQHPHTDPFHVINGVELIKKAYMQTWGFDYARAGCGPTDFEYKALD